MTGPGPTAYCRACSWSGRARWRTRAALVKRAHDELDARGISITLLHYAQLNPLSAPFWSRMGYRRCGPASSRARRSPPLTAAVMIVHVLAGMLRFSLWLPQKRRSATLWLIDGGTWTKTVDKGD